MGCEARGTWSRWHLTFQRVGTLGGKQAAHISMDDEQVDFNIHTTNNYFHYIAPLQSHSLHARYVDFGTREYNTPDRPWACARWE